VVKVSRVSKDAKELLEILVVKEPLEALVVKELLDHQEVVVIKVSKDARVLRDAKALKVIKEILVIKELLVLAFKDLLEVLVDSVVHSLLINGLILLMVKIDFTSQITHILTLNQLITSTSEQKIPIRM
jgi:hypothetical protein